MTNPPYANSLNPSPRNDNPNNPNPVNSYPNKASEPLVVSLVVLPCKPPKL